ncbi:hypothetical protein [Bacillus subtilis]|uniref:hypothetical protein n=1 Tax=Bacillus subtilis TaxID=1423 RepID=UPI0018A71863|nr:hypothetical protein [Bacillus subtilis]QPG30463.1 hypothetical protein ITP52_17590 [Bacillus subtilis]
MLLELVNMPEGEKDILRKKFDELLDSNGSMRITADKDGGEVTYTFEVRYIPKQNSGGVYYDSINLNASMR